MNEEGLMNLLAVMEVAGEKIDALQRELRAVHSMLASTETQLENVYETNDDLSKRLLEAGDALDQARKENAALRKQLGDFEEVGSLWDVVEKAMREAKIVQVSIRRYDEDDEQPCGVIGVDDSTWTWGGTLTEAVESFKARHATTPNQEG